MSPGGKVASTKKIRFVAITAKGPRQLFSVTERADKSLVIASRSGDLHEMHLGQAQGAVEIVEDRYSVHISPKSSGTTIKHTMKLGNGRVITNSSFVQNSKKRLLWPIFVERAGDVEDNDRYVYRAKARDENVHIAVFNGAFNSLLYGVAVSNVGLETRLKSNKLFNLTTYRLSRFQVLVFSTYLHVPGHPTLDTVRTATSPEHVDGNPVGGSVYIDATSMSDDDLEHLVLSQFVALRRRLIERYRSNPRMSERTTNQLIAALDHSSVSPRTRPETRSVVKRLRLWAPGSRLGKKR